MRKGRATTVSTGGKRAGLVDWGVAIGHLKEPGCNAEEDCVPQDRTPPKGHR